MSNLSSLQQQIVSEAVAAFREKFPYDEEMEAVDDGGDGGTVPIGTYFLKDAQPHDIESFLTDQLHQAMRKVAEEERLNLVSAIALESHKYLKDLGETDEEGIAEIVSNAVSWLNQDSEGNQNA